MSSKGRVEEVKDGIIYATGLEDVGINELVNIYSEEYQEIKGIAINLDSEIVGILALGDYKKIKEGDVITTTGKLASIDVNKNYLGRVLDPLGNPLDGKGPISTSLDMTKGTSLDMTKGTSLDTVKGTRPMPLDKIAPGVIERKDVDRPLQTGIIAIDSMIPVGRGQRQLIIGDRQIGKTAIAIDTIINQKDKNCICIYVAIGQKNSKTAQIISKLEETGALENTIIVNSSSADPVAMEYLAPFTGTAIGEFFAENGEDALIIYDDLSKHAQAYREISLLLKRPSGREAYPGDIFYLHAKLLERSVQFSDEKDGGSLTSLPIVETQSGDVSAYIPTNIISITDGQIYLEKDLFNAGQKPAVSIGISVSRVGGAAQTKALKSVSKQLKLDLAQYRELAAFAQFGSDLDKETKFKLERGSKIMEIMKQDQFDPMDVDLMSVLIFSVNNGYMDNIDNSFISKWIDGIKKEEQILKGIDINQKVEGEIEVKLKSKIEKFNTNFLKIYSNKDVE